MTTDTYLFFLIFWQCRVSSREKNKMFKPLSNAKNTVALHGRSLKLVPIVINLLPLKYFKTFWMNFLSGITRYHLIMKMSRLLNSIQYPNVLSTAHDLEHSFLSRQFSVRSIWERDPHSPRKIWQIRYNYPLLKHTLPLKNHPYRFL